AGPQEHAERDDEQGQQPQPELLGVVHARTLLFAASSAPTADPALMQVKRAWSAAGHALRIGAASASSAARSAISTSRRSTRSTPSFWKRLSTRLTVSGASRR